MMIWIYPRTDADLPQNEATQIYQLSQSERSGGWYSGMRAFFCEQTGMPEPRSERKRTRKPRNERCRIRAGMTETQSECSGGWCPAKRPFFGSETDTRAAKRAQTDTEAAQRAMPDQGWHDGSTKRV